MCFKISSILYITNLYLQSLKTKLFEKEIR